MNCSKMILATALFISASAYAKKPVVIGEPSKGTTITKIQDGKDKVEITTTGIKIEEGDDEKGEETSPATVKDDEGKKYPSIGLHTEEGEGIVGVIVPVAFFLFILCSILGVKYISSRNEQRRLELLKLMVEKGQAVPDSVVNSILAPAPALDESNGSSYKRYRNAYGFSIGGFLLMSYALMTHSYDGGAMICGLIFLCIGAGGLAGLYLPKRGQGQDKA